MDKDPSSHYYQCNANMTIEACSISSECEAMEVLRNASSTDVCSFNQSRLHIFIPERQPVHLLTPLNNAALSSRTTSDRNRRSSLLHSLFGRSTARRKTPIVKQVLKPPKQLAKRRSISGGDQVKLSSAMIAQKSTLRDGEGSLQGLRYDFQPIQSASSTNASQQKQPAEDHREPIPVPFTGRSSLVRDESASSLSDLALIRPPASEKKQIVQSAQSVMGVPKTRVAASTSQKTAFDPHQHKYATPTPSYHYPKRLSAIETLAKKYSTSLASRNSMGLFWYSANQQTMSRTVLFPKRDTVVKRKGRADSSSDSRDTSTSSNTSATTASTESNTGSTSSSSSTTSLKSTNPTNTSQSSLHSANSSSSTDTQTTKVHGQYNRNQNRTNDFIRIDLNSTASQTSTSTSGTSLQCYHRRSVSRKQLSSTSSSTTTDRRDSSSQSLATNNNTRVNKSTLRVPLATDLFSSVDARIIGKFKVKRQRIERNLLV